MSLPRSLRARTNSALLRKAFSGSALAAALVVALGACGSSSESDGSKDAASPPSPTKTATADQYAEMVKDADLESIVNETFHACSIFPDPSCSIKTKTISVRAHRLLSAWDAAQDPSGSEYIGDPPSEVAALVEATRSHATAAAEAADQIIAMNCPFDGSDSNKCLSLEAHLTAGTLLDLTHDLEGGWKPYL